MAFFLQYLSAFKSLTAQRESEHLSCIAFLNLEVQNLLESAALTSKLAYLKHDVHVLNKSIELAHDEARLATKAEAQAR